ncbi:hypothetical protein IV02_04295 [Pseudomonas syringae]|uniref:Uncharacterized protein n=1 Tax=Pseudomonas syringae TaxID=317 RepID=A0A085VEW1_PSESX|nr:hypothetical protein IV02_04295 [Pseudomonas syringae]
MSGKASGLLTKIFSACTGVFGGKSPPTGLCRFGRTGLVREGVWPAQEPLQRWHWRLRGQVPSYRVVQVR